MYYLFGFTSQLLIKCEQGDLKSEGRVGQLTWLDIKNAGLILLFDWFLRGKQFLEQEQFEGEFEYAVPENLVYVKGFPPIIKSYKDVYLFNWTISFYIKSHYEKKKQIAQLEEGHCELIHLVLSILLLLLRLEQRQLQLLYLKNSKMNLQKSRSVSKISKTQIDPSLKYQICQMIGQGQFGKVYKAYRKQQLTLKGLSNIFAIKVIPLCKFKKNPKLKQLLNNQILILSRLKHPHIIQFQELIVWDEKIYMVYEHCEGGNLEDKLPLSQNQAIPIFAKILSAFIFAQKNSILHRDIKPANILFKNGEPRVADWGFSRYLQEDFTATSFVGSPAYMAPELLKGYQYTNKADVWSFGVMLYECMFNQMPWPSRNIKQLLQKVKLIPLDLPKQLDPSIKMIIRNSLQMDPGKRCSFFELKNIQISKKITKTEQIENPQQHKQAGQLSQMQIRMCSYYLQFAKQSQSFEDNEVIQLCLQFILQNLRKIESDYQKEGFLKKDLLGCQSQRKISHPKREFSSTHSSKKSHQEERKRQISQTCELLHKQISLIEKIKANCSSVTSFSSPMKKQIKKQEISSKKLVKQIVKRLIKKIGIVDSDRTQPIVTKRQLIEMNCILEMIMYQEQKQPDTKKLKLKIKQMQETGMTSLIRTLNHRILFVNEFYCKN